MKRIRVELDKLDVLLDERISSLNHKENVCIRRIIRTRDIKVLVAKNRWRRSVLTQVQKKIVHVLMLHDYVANSDAVYIRHYKVPAKKFEDLISSAMSISRRPMKCTP